MRNLKEVRPLLSAIYCINRTGSKDEDIEKILDYAFNRLFNQNTNLLKLACIGRTKEDSMQEIKQILKEDTSMEVE
ncbi:MAG: hypothetical protein E7341_02170 [Clostridiales bacterium]|nr:hypothetical protein [Clostridiales bacterium]